MHMGFTHRSVECDLQSSLLPTNSQIIQAGLVLPVRCFRSERFCVYYTLNLKCSGVLETSIYCLQYIHQLGTGKRKLFSVEASSKNPASSTHFRLTLAFFFPLRALNSWKLSVSYISLLLHKPVGRDTFL